MVGNNLANLNTTGYKAQRIVFKDMVYQQLRSGSSGDATSVGGTNAARSGTG